MFLKNRFPAVAFRTDLIRFFGPQACFWSARSSFSKPRKPRRATTANVVPMGEHSILVYFYTPVGGMICNWEVELEESFGSDSNISACGLHA